MKREPGEGPVSATEVKYGGEGAADFHSQAPITVRGVAPIKIQPVLTSRQCSPLS